LPTTPALRWSGLSIAANVDAARRAKPGRGAH
jgi:hypothetical protein